MATLCFLSAAFAASSLLVQGARTKRQASNDSSATFSRCQAKREFALHFPPTQGLSARLRPPLVMVGELLERGRVECRGAEVNIGHMWPSGDRGLCVPVSVRPARPHHFALCFCPPLAGLVQVVASTAASFCTAAFHGLATSALAQSTGQVASCPPRPFPAECPPFPWASSSQKMGQRLSVPASILWDLAKTSGKRISFGQT